MTALRILSTAVAIIVGTVIALNAAFMLASPRAWFRLPSWLRATGTMTEQRFGKSWRAAEVRIAGALILGAETWVLYDMFVTRR